jgi:2-polyprenyl-3-methyl-5-hydroxy-6-metoxy-1,4-benzoquinol methylase
MLFNVNSDTDKSFISRIIWLVENFIRNLNRTLVRGGKVIVLSNDFINIKNSDVLKRLSTPSRCLSDMFWHSLPWDDIKIILGGKIDVLDLGCGSGLYGKEIDVATKGALNSYHGIDIQEHEQWRECSKLNGKLSYSIAGVEDINKTYNAQGLIISQSVLEHIPNDRKLIEDVCNIAMSTKSRIIQIHLIPSSACYYKYLWHGYRQYTPKNIEKILKNVKNSKCYLIPLGGKKCNKTHIKWITIPEVIKRLLGIQNKDWTIEESYMKERNRSIQVDHDHPSHINKASFYAVIIDHNSTEDLEMSICRHFE